MSKKNSIDIYSSSRRKAKKGKVAAIIIIISVVLLLLAAAWVWFFQRDLIKDLLPAETTAPTTEQVTTVAQTTAEETLSPVTEQRVEVPYVIGYAAKDAYDKLNSVGLRYTVVREYSDTVKADYVLSQEPEAGETVKQSEQIILHISKGTDHPVEVTVAAPLSTDPTEATTGTSKKGDSSEYILEDSDTRYVTKSELYDLDEDELTLALNEIYARYGRKFKTPEIQAYFSKQSWYKGTIDPADFDEDIINSVESANVKTILEVMSEKGYR